MFSATPESSRWWRMGRSVLAFSLGYGVPLIWMYAEYTYQPIGISNPISGRTVGAWFLWGAFLTAAYISWWELKWRFKYRNKLISIRKGLGDDWVNGKALIIGMISTILLFIIFIIPLTLMILERKGIINLN